MARKKQQSLGIRAVLVYNLLHRMKEKGWDAKRLAEESGVSRSFVFDLLRLEKSPTSDVIRLLEVALGMRAGAALSEPPGTPLEMFFGFFEESLMKLLVPGDDAAHERERGRSLKAMIDLMVEGPDLAEAMMHCFKDTARWPDVGERKGLLANNLIRAMQEEQENYCDDIEKLAAQLLEKHFNHRPGTVEGLRAILGRHGYDVSEESFEKYPSLRQQRSVLVSEKKILLINEKLMSCQKAFQIARELGYLELGLLGNKSVSIERDITSPRREVTSFWQLWADYRASYFAGAILHPETLFLDDIHEFFAQRHFNPEHLVGLLKQRESTPEMFFYRFSQLVPHHFGLKKLHLLRFHTDIEMREEKYGRRTDRGDKVFRLSKYLNMGSLPFAEVESISESYCRRWQAVSLLQAMKDDIKEDGHLKQTIYCDAQHSQFIGLYEQEEAESFCMTLARRLQVEDNILSSVTLGFPVDDQLKKTVHFLDDPKIPIMQAGQTCQRCSLLQCEEREYPATIFSQLHEAEQREADVQRLLKEEHGIVLPPRHGAGD